MKTAVISLLAVLLLIVVGCRKSGPGSSSSSTPADALEGQLRNIAGQGATNCGRVGVSGDVKKVSDCAMEANAAKRPFYVAYDLPGGDAGTITFAFAGNSEGKVFHLEQNPKGWPAETSGGKLSDNNRVFTTDCPAPLRLAQSQRVTCMPPGGNGMGMGTNPHGGMTGVNPHGGMMGTMPGTTNPHGGMMMPPPGTPNPHGQAAPAHGGNAPAKPKQ